MPVFRWGQNWNPLHDLEREVDRLLQGVNLSLQSVRSSRRFPLLNLVETEDSYVIVAEIPGMDAADLEITAGPGVLTIKGIRKQPPEAVNETFRRQERFHGPWQRTVQLPDRINEDDLKAEYTAGILRITLSRAPSTAVRQIPITEGPDA